MLTPFSVSIPNLVEGDRIEENRSRFAAFGGPCPGGSDIQPLVEGLIVRHRLKKASHISWAARFATPEGRTAEMKDDGGESGAGRVILDVMRARDAGGCLVLIARWYGGRHLGGMRFRIYRNLAERILSGSVHA
jgi:putative IMPACT (imprinted ancient) family translation regulator